MIVELIQANPKVSIILIAIAVTLVSMMITKLLTNQEKMKDLKNKQSACKDLMKKHKGNSAKMMEIQKELMACSMEQMKAGFKPMLITFIPFIILFGFIRNVFATTSIAGGWFWYYLITALAASMILRKVLKM
ncbi:MAG: DUF2208 family protein [Nanoarchaeota archaeon]|nr:DUF2208 family protein [Nanoarchaeota archaeon]